MRRLFQFAGAIVLTAAFLQTLRIGWADYLFHRDTADSVRQAETVWPRDARFEARLADLDPPNAVAHLRHALSLDPGLSKTWIQLGLQLELQGNVPEAEQCFLEAARRDRQFLPAWTLANFYARRNDPARFWPWARKAAEMSYDDIAPLLRLAFGFTSDPRVVLEQCVIRRPKIQREFLYYLVNQGMDASSIAARIMEKPTPDDARPLLAWLDRLIAAQRIADARALWDALSDRRLIPYPHAQAITNPDFAHAPLQCGFDWRIDPPDGITISPGAGMLRIDFSGRQPETSEIASQFLAADPGQYRLSFEYRTSGIPATTGLRWWIGDANSDPFPASDDWRTLSWNLRSAAASRLILLEQREPGATRPEGVVYLRNLKLQSIGETYE
jgi:tetratricopeptide (TPR) repeat protein